MAADVVGYSRLMERDEAGTLAALKKRRREILQPLVTHSAQALRRRSAIILSSDLGSVGPRPDPR